MGGAVPLGYRVENRALHVVEDEAEFVRALFRRYLEVGSVVRLKTALDAENVRSPVRMSGSGRKSGGARILRGHLYWILSHVVARQGAMPSDIDLAVFSEHLRSCRCPRAMGEARMKANSSR